MPHRSDFELLCRAGSLRSAEPTIASSASARIGFREEQPPLAVGRHAAGIAPVLGAKLQMHACFSQTCIDSSASEQKS